MAVYTGENDQIYVSELLYSYQTLTHNNAATLLLSSLSLSNTSALHSRVRLSHSRKQCHMLITISTHFVYRV